MEMNNFSLVNDDATTSVCTMNDVVNSYFDNHKGNVNYAFLTTYDGMDVTVLGDLLLLLPGGNKIINDKKFDVCCGAKKNIIGIENSYLSQLLLSCTHRILVNNAFHPKILMFYYQSEDDSEKIFLIIGSKNITSGEYLDAYVCLEGKVSDGEGNNGKELKEILTESSFWGGTEVKDIFSDEAIKRMNELEKYQFELWEESDEESEGPVVSFHRANEALKDAIISTGDRETIVVSPFVTDEKWDNKYNFRLYTSSGTAESLKNIPRGGVYYLDVTNISIHAKIYITPLKEETKVWIGSANFTTSAFSENNSEILVCLTYKDEKQEIYAALKNTFEEKINNKCIWQEKSQNVENAEEIEVEKKTIIPLKVYEKLDKSLEVIEFKVSEKFECSYSYKDIEIGGVKIIDIIPKSGKPTRNGCVLFTYAVEGKEVEGNFTFDILSKISDQKIKDKYVKLLDEYIKCECLEYNRLLLNPYRKTSSGKKNPPPENTETKSGQKKRRINTLFDIVLQLKLTQTEEKVKKLLSEYEKNYIGKLPEKEAQLIKLYSEV